MRIRTDDEVYRVDAVWLGPPRATFPWRARYVAWGVGIPLFLVVLGVERQLGIGFGFFSTAWAFVITIALTRVITSKISHERPLGAVFSMWLQELRTPREDTRASGGAASASKIKVRTERPRPRTPRRSRAKYTPQHLYPPRESFPGAGGATLAGSPESPRNQWNRWNGHDPGRPGASGYAEYLAHARNPEHSHDTGPLSRPADPPGSPKNPEPPENPENPENTARARRRRASSPVGR